MHHQRESIGYFEFGVSRKISFCTVPSSNEPIQVLDFRIGIAVGVCLGYQRRERA
jgi:hypothetical protein